MNQQIVNALFETHAIRVCQADYPFWYTSGKLGPFYINTHFLYGSEESAIALLTLIEEAAAGDRCRFINIIFEAMDATYRSNPIYKMVIDKVILAAKEMDFDFISGGERRDFFFSVLAAYYLKVPHLSIFKDGSSFYSSADLSVTVPSSEVDLKGKKSLHIVDLITEASSFTRAWIPVIRALEAEMTNALTVIDRLQGGREVLTAENIEMTSLLEIDVALFEAASTTGDIDAEQLALVKTFLEKPEEFMPDFLEKHPNFIKQQILLGGKNEERARLAIEKGFAD